MRLLVNGAWREISSGDLAAAVEELGFGGSVVATAINGQFVPASGRRAVPLEEGDLVEVLAPMQGG